MMMKVNFAVSLAVLGLALTGCAQSSDNPEPVMESGAVPASVFDLSHWNITLPDDKDGNNKPDTVSVADIQTFSHPDFFYLDDQGRMVFTSPNKAITTPNSSNTRSELRYMLRGDNTQIKTKAPGNNFSLAAQDGASQFGAIGGKMQATLQVDHVSLNAGYPDKFPAYSTVIGQIHAVKYDGASNGFGYGNEPLKIYYKKFPGHETGSVFWTYERNLAKEDPKRRDIAYAVWGNTWDNPANPGQSGIALGEEISYEVNVYQDTMHLTFDSPRLGRVTHSINLTNNIDAKGNVDSDDNPLGYTGDAHYFKAGAYNQCSTKDDPGFWYAACPGTGDWATDKANGNYVQVRFSRLVVSEGTPPAQ